MPDSAPDRERGPGRRASLIRRVLDLDLEVARAYRRWWRPVLLLAAVIFVPLYLLDLTIVELVDAGFGDNVAGFLALLAGAVAVMITSLFGQVLLAGVIGRWLVRPARGSAPEAVEVARRLRFGQLVLLGLASVALTITGLALLIVPGVVLAVMLAPAAPVMNIEGRAVGGSLRRAVGLVRSDFWLAFWVLLPVKLASYLAGLAVSHGSAVILGDETLAADLASLVSSVLISPIYAIAAVVLTLRLIASAGPCRPVIPVQSETGPEPAPGRFSAASRAPGGASGSASPGSRRRRPRSP